MLKVVHHNSRTTLLCRIHYTNHPTAPHYGEIHQKLAQHTRINGKEIGKNPDKRRKKKRIKNRQKTTKKIETLHNSKRKTPNTKVYWRIYSHPKLNTVTNPHSAEAWNSVTRVNGKIRNVVPGNKNRIVFMKDLFRSQGVQF